MDCLVGTTGLAMTGPPLLFCSRVCDLGACVGPEAGASFVRGTSKKESLLPRGFVGVSASGKVFGDGNKNGRHP